MSSTPTLDKHALHPFGGYCSCFSAPIRECQTCKRIQQQNDRWASLSEEELKAAKRELAAAYPSTSNQDGR